MESDLKMRDAVRRACNTETVKSQQATVCGLITQSTQHVPVAVDALHARQTQPKSMTHHFSTASREMHTAKQQQPSLASPLTRKCGWCRKDQHSCNHCPAQNARCHHCNKLGHYATVCRSSTRTKAYKGSVQESFLGAIPSDVPWTRPIYINEVLMQIKLDTGTDATAIPETVYHTKLHSSPSLIASFKVQTEKTPSPRLRQIITVANHSSIISTLRIWRLWGIIIIARLT